MHDPCAWTGDLGTCQGLGQRSNQSIIGLRPALCHMCHVGRTATSNFREAVSETNKESARLLWQEVYAIRVSTRALVKRVSLPVLILHKAQGALCG